MNNIEIRLWEEKARLNELSAPEDMEARLRNALNTANPRRKAKWYSHGSWRTAAAVIAFILFAGNQYHALAYYGKIMFGFDGIVNGALSELNEQGKGQALDDQVTLSDGTVLSVNGIMSDENQLILYYTLSHPNGFAEADTNQFQPVRINGFRTDSMFTTGASGPSEDGTETKGILTFDPVSPLAKKLTLYYWEDIPNSDQRLERHLTFPYHPDEAIATTVKQPIQQTVAIDNGTITFGSIIATPTMTLIEGTVKIENDNNFGQVTNGVELFVNGESIPQLRGEAHRTQNGGYVFTLRYDSLPINLQSIQLVLKKNRDIVEIPVK
jgi:hypothetical protein